MNSVMSSRALKSFGAPLIAFAAGATALFAGSTTQSLFDALRQGDAAKVRAAVISGVDVNSQDRDGNTLLMQAAVYGTVADLDFLLAHGANVNVGNEAGHTPVMRAMPDLAKIKLLAEHGANINAATVDGTTPLMLAAGIRTDGDVVRYLIAKGANLRATDRLGPTRSWPHRFQARTGISNPAGCRGERQGAAEECGPAPADRRQRH